MENTHLLKWQADRLLLLGILLFLLGLIVALLIPMMNNPRMGVSAHLEGTMNGMFLLILGLIWIKVSVNGRWLKTAFWLTIYGSFANFLAVSLGAFTGAGKMMPIAGGKEGTTLIEGLISFLLISLTLAMLVVCCIVLTGLYRYMRHSAEAKKG
ncbi:MAG: hydrogenase [Bacteroidetes bacterium RIFCSPHIGHO2_02_FULL_44_7]|nr:MAG: hydrogenase [Bacteroidetes bacterium RIFCSPHIGHO2_02_FULL_44_7]